MNAIIILVSIVLSLGRFATTYTEPVKPTVESHEVTIYIFRGNGCPHCTNAVKYFNSRHEENVNVVTYEVWYNSNNEKLRSLVLNELELSTKGVPFIIVGDTYYFVGFSNGDEIMNIAIKETQNKDYVDLVQKVIEKNNIENITATSIEEAINEEM